MSFIILDMQVFIAILIGCLYGLVEGITEWLPISSTGHMILLSSIPGLRFDDGAFFDLFLVIIQLGAILALVIVRFRRLNPFSAPAGPARKDVWKLWLKILIGCIPAGVAGILLKVLLDDRATENLNSPLVIGIMLILVGIAFIVVERLLKVRQRKLGEERDQLFKYCEVKSIPLSVCAYIGLAQVLSLIPGTSRSGVTILTALALGVDRVAGLEYSFYLAIPIMIGASLVSVIEFILGGGGVSGLEWAYLSAGFLVAFSVSLIVVKVLLNWIKKHTFEGFGYYRIALGAVVIGLSIDGII